MQDAAAIQGIESRYAAMVSLMDERIVDSGPRRKRGRMVGVGYARSAVPPGCRRTRLQRGLAELEAREADPEAPIGSRLRKAGAGRKRATEADPELAAALEQLVDPVTRGDPMSPLRWTCKSTTQLARELTRQGHPVSPRTVGTSVEGSRIQFAGQPQDEGRERSSRSQRPVRAHQRDGSGVSRTRPTGDLGGHEEEGIGRGISATAGGNGNRRASPTKCWSMTSWTRSWAKPSRTASTTDGEPRLGERRHRSRHRTLRDGSDSSLVEEDGIEASPWRRRSC